MIISFRNRRMIIIKVFESYKVYYVRSSEKGPWIYAYFESMEFSVKCFVDSRAVVNLSRPEKVSAIIKFLKTIVKL